MTSPSEHLVALAREHAERLERITKDCTQAVGKLDAARLSYEKGFFKNSFEVIKILSPYIVVLLIYFLMQNQECGTSVKIKEIEFSKTCSHK